MRLALVRSVPMNKEQSIREAGRIWANTVAELPELKKRIRAAAEAEIERETELRRAEAARAIKYARDRGATKVALRGVTTKDHHDFESYIALGAELAEKEGEWEPDSSPSAWRERKERERTA